MTSPEERSGIDRQDLEDQATEWLVRVRFGLVDPALFMQWRAQSSAHQAAAREAEAVWVAVGDTRTARTFPRGQIPQSPSCSREKPMGVGRRKLMVATAAAVTGIAVVGLRERMGSGEHSTRTGERKWETLPDGSSVMLNTATDLTVEYGQYRRLIVSRGEALFQVAPDDPRLFQVQAANGIVHTQGGIFNLRRDGDVVDLTVTSGMVNVRPHPDAEPALVRAGLGLRYAPGRPTQSPHVVDIQAATAWERGKLIFNQTPLSQVVAEVGRYMRGSVVIANEGDGLRPVSGVFDLAEPGEILRILARTMGLNIIRLPFVTILR